ncbi:MAG: hypothetical protein JW860_14100 [Sedimentisphaerales bacterium]|nr:hypothetical protein [Sedimentisphaerales bacterium]
MVDEIGGDGDQDRVGVGRTRTITDVHGEVIAKTGRGGLYQLEFGYAGTGQGMGPIGRIGPIGI